MDILKSGWGSSAITLMFLDVRTVWNAQVLKFIDLFRHSPSEDRANTGSLPFYRSKAFNGFKSRKKFLAIPVLRPCFFNYFGMFARLIGKCLYIIQTLPYRKRGLPVNRRFANTKRSYKTFGISHQAGHFIYVRPKTCQFIKSEWLHGLILQPWPV